MSVAPQENEFRSFPETLPQKGKFFTLPFFEDEISRANFNALKSRVTQDMVILTALEVFLADKTRLEQIAGELPPYHNPFRTHIASFNLLDYGFSVKQAVAAGLLKIRLEGLSYKTRREILADDDLLSDLDQGARLVSQAISELELKDQLGQVLQIDPELIEYADEAAKKKLGYKVIQRQEIKEKEEERLSISESPTGQTILAVLSE